MFPSKHSPRQRGTVDATTVEMDRNTASAASGAAVAGTAALSEFLRVVTNHPWPGFTATSSHTVSILLALILTATATTLLLRRRSWPIAEAAWLLALSAPWILFVHGAVIAGIGGARDDVGWQVRAAGAVYFVAAISLGVLVKNTFGDGEMLRLRQLRFRRRPEARAIHAHA